mgnify:CR=1 FL=1
MIKLITIDIDGTLLTTTRFLPKKNKEMILKAKKLGAHIALVSGRPYSGILPYVKELELKEEGHFSISQNGSYIFDNYTNEVITGTYQNPKDLILLDSSLRDFKVQVSAMDDKNFYTRHKYPNFFTISDSIITKLKLQKISYDKFDENKTFGRFLIMGWPGEINKLMDNMPKIVKDNFYYVKTSPFLIEVMNLKTNKGYAIKLMSESLGYKLEEIMAIGNEMNDIPMLEMAGFAVATANSNDLLKPHADFITKSNNKAGVGYALEKLIENNFEKF